jgi:hypothetical protein
VIENSKYILNVKCSLWNKRLDVINALEAFKSANINTDDVYAFYCSQHKNLMVSKRYFDKNL